MVFGVNFNNVGRDVTRGAVTELKRQAKGLNPIPLLKSKFKSKLEGLKNAIIGKGRRGRGRGRGRRGRGRIPPPFFKGYGRRRRRGGRRRRLV